MTRRPSMTWALITMLWASSAWADNTTCANAEPLIVGSQSSDFLPAFTGAGSGEIYFKTRLTGQRSYIFWVYPPFQDAGEGVTDVSLTLFTDVTCATEETSISTSEREPLENIVGADVDQISVKPIISGTYVLKIVNGVGAGYTVAVSAVETSVFSPWWFVGGTNQAFVTIRNNMANPTTVTIRLFSSIGLLCGLQDIAMGGNTNTFRRLNDFSSCVSPPYFGSAAITYFGPPGGIVANTTVIDAAMGISFDEPFTPRMVWSILTR